MGIPIAILHSVRHIPILTIRVVAITAVDEAVTIPVVMEVLRAQSVILLHRHGCNPARGVLCVDSGCQVDSEGDDVESEDERYSPFQHGCSIADFLEVAHSKCC